MERILPIAWPAGGLSEAWSLSDQPEGTAREYQNVRFQDPRTGRLRGAQRSGLSKYLSSALKAVDTKVVGMTGFFVDNRQVTYTAISSGSETTTWDTKTPAGGEVLNVKTDRQGNVYALNGDAGVVKYSSDGAKLWELAIPVADSAHLCRALAVDDNDLVFVGVSEGGLQEKAKLFCFEQLPDNKTQKVWEIETKAYIEDMKILGGKLYTCQNLVDRARAWVRIYEFVTSANPEMTKEWRVPYPVNSIAVRTDGAVFVACEPSGDTSDPYFRLPDPTFPEFSPDSEVWNPYKLSNFAKRNWSWYVPDDIDETDVASDLEDGVQILRLRDRSKGLRHFFAELENSNEGPILAVDGLLGHKAVRFTSGARTGTLQVMHTNPNASFSKAFADQQRTMIPVYTGAAWVLFMVLRISRDDKESDNRVRVCWGQDRDNSSTGGLKHILYINRAASSSTSAGSTSAGDICFYTGSSGGSGGGGQPDEGQFDNDNQTVIVTIYYNGALSGHGQGAFRINGHPIDLFVGSATSTSLYPTYLGLARQPNGTYAPSDASSFLGDVLEVICFDRQDRQTDATDVMTIDRYDPGVTADTDQTFTEVNAIEGYLAHKYGIQHLLPRSDQTYEHPYGIEKDSPYASPDWIAAPPDVTGAARSIPQALANKRFGCVVKYSAEGAIKWTANEMELESASRSGGYGYAVAVNSDGNIYSLGPAPTGAAGNNVQVRMIVDQDTDFSIATADGAWSTAYPSNYNQTYKYPRIDVDEFDNLYLPFPATGGTVPGFRVYKKDGTILHDGTAGSGTASYCIAVDRRIPDYRSDLTTKRVEHVVVGTNQTAVTDDNLFKKRLVSAAQASGSVRSLYTMAASGGDIVRFTTSTVTTPTGGSSALDSSAKYVQATSLFKKAYWTDGRQYRVYDPITNAVTAYTCTSAGEMPPRCALIESWRGRIVLARSADEPHNWFMSAKDEPNNFDYFPPVPNETQAVAGNNSAAGLCPDIINSVVPYSEDILVFGGDHSIWALVGDPAAGGRLELVSDITGMAFGRPWCKDPDGVLYFVGSRGGLFRWVPGGKPERLSLYKIERQLQDIDFSTYHVKLFWNYQDEGLHILQLPFGAGGTQVSHWFWEAKSDAFSKDLYGHSSYTNVQPTDALVIDGDDFDDRLLLFGCEDGYVRKWNKSSKSDDTRSDGTTKQAIDSIVTIFPIQAGEQATGLETQFQGLTVVLGDSQDGARYELFASDEPELPGVSERQGTLGPGRNPPKWDRVVGPYCGLRLRNSAAEETWSFERAYIHAIPAGMARPRMVN